MLEIQIILHLVKKNHNRFLTLNNLKQQEMTIKMVLSYHSC